MILLRYWTEPYGKIPVFTRIRIFCPGIIHVLAGARTNAVKGAINDQIQ